MEKSIDMWSRVFWATSFVEQGAKKRQVSSVLFLSVRMKSQRTHLEEEVIDVSSASDSLGLKRGGNLSIDYSKKSSEGQHPDCTRTCGQTHNFSLSWDVLHSNWSPCSSAVCGLTVMVSWGHVTWWSTLYLWIERHTILKLGRRIILIMFFGGNSTMCYTIQLTHIQYNLPSVTYMTLSSVAEETPDFPSCAPIVEI